MSGTWPKMRLGNVLRRSEETIQLQPDSEYRELTVKLWGKGVVLRGIVSGTSVAAQRRYVVRASQFILSRIDARNGALGIVPPELDGAIVSNDFPVYDIATDRLLPAFLGWMSRTASFVEACQRASEGTTNRVRLKEDAFLEIEISLPPLEGQWRLLRRIEELAAKIRKAQGCRVEARAETETLWLNAFREVLVGNGRGRSRGKLGTGKDLLAASATRNSRSASPNHNNAHPHEPKSFDSGPTAIPHDWIWTTVGSVLTHLIDCVNDTPNFAEKDTGLIGLKSTNVRPYQLNLTRRWFMTPEDFVSWNRREQPRAGDILLTREAPMGYACFLPSGYQVCLTQRLMLLRPDPDTILPKLLLHYLNSPHFHDQVEEQSRGLTTPHIRVQDAPNFLLPLPPMDEQRCIVAELDTLQVQVEALKRLQGETAAALDALIPTVLDRAFGDTTQVAV